MLHLSVIDDGKTYAQRMALTKAPHIDHFESIRALVLAQALLERRMFGTAFTSEDVNEAAARVMEYDLRSVQTL